MAFHHKVLLDSYTNASSTEIPEDCFSCCGQSYCFSPPIDLQVNQSNKNLSLLVIIIIAILSSLFVLVSYYVIIAKYCSCWRNSTRPPQQSNNREETNDETRNPIHHIWYLNTVGLEQSVIDSISVCKYKRDEGLVEGTECSVCLNEFNEDECLRLLPKCSHAFHLPCIDKWLRSHVNCPLCRASVMSTPVNSSPTDLNSSSLEIQSETPVENSQSNTGLVSNRRIVTEGDELYREDERKDIKNGKSMFSSYGALSDFAGNGIEPVRRSISMDSLAASMIRFSLNMNILIESEGSSSALEAQLRDGKESDGSSQIVFKLMRNSSKVSPLQKGPVSMKRSFSSGGKFFLSRYGRSRSSILPL